jgi:hypothetical protein
MQNQIIKQEIYDNAADTFIVINPTKQQIIFFPKEESQMFTSKTHTHAEGTIVAGMTSNPDTESENTDSLAFMNRVSQISQLNSPVSASSGSLVAGRTYTITAFVALDNFSNVATVISGTINTTGCVFLCTGTTPTNWSHGSTLTYTPAPTVLNNVKLDEYGASLPYPSDSDKYKFNMQSINSSHTATDYIGATTATVTAVIADNFADFKIWDINSGSVSDLYDVSDSTVKAKFIRTGFQTLRIPANKLNTILTDQDAIEANNNSNIKKNFGQYYFIVAPKYVQTVIGNVILRKHTEWLDMGANGSPTVSGIHIQINPDDKRRTIYECDKDNFKTLPWDFETSGEQSGRLYGSIVEIWDSTQTTLKQVKVMTENEFNFNTSDSMRFVLYPDNVGYDTPEQAIISGDIVRIYPRESYFNQIVLEVNYKDKTLQVENLLAFMLNDTVRDMMTGIYEIYDNNGFTIDSSGNYTGNVVNRFQIFQTDKNEARKRIK